MSDKLKNFYEEKYTRDRNKKSLPNIPYVKYPVDRYQACIKYFTDHFRGKSIMELGAGDGLITNSLLNSRLPIEKYMASEFSENRLQSISGNIRDPRLEVRQIDAEGFDFEAIGKFDAIIMVALIEHLIDPMAAMSSIKNALAPGGFIYIDTPNVADYGCRFKLLRGKFPSTSAREEGLITYEGEKVSLLDEGHLHYFTYGSLSNMLINYSGYKKTSKYYYPVGKLFLGKRMHYALAKLWPEMFSYLALIAE